MMKYKLSIRMNAKLIAGLMAISAVALLSYLIVNMKYNVPLYEVLGWIWAIAIIIIMLNQADHIQAGGSVKRILYVRIVIGVVLAILMTIRFNSGIFDSDEGSLLTGSIGYFRQLFTGEDFFEPYSDANPVFKSALMNLFSFVGINSICIRIIYLYLWFLGYKLIEKVAFDVRNKEYKILTAFYAFMPWEILINSKVLREPMICMSLMLSLYFLWKWMKTAWFRYIVIAAIMPIFAIALHGGNIAMLGVIFATYTFWDCKRQRWRVPHFSWRLVPVIAILIVLPFSLQIVHALNIDRFSSINGISDLMRIQQDAIVYNGDASTFYAREFDLSSPIGIVLMLLYRSVYFWISPSPMFWTSPTHAIAFLADSCVWIAYFIYMIRNVFIKKTNKAGGLFIPIVLFFTLIYGVGTHTGGTAMRHRGQLLGLLVMCAVMNMKEDKYGNKEYAAIQHNI